MRDKPLLASKTTIGGGIVILIETLESLGWIPAGAISQLFVALEGIGGFLAVWGIRDLLGGYLVAVKGQAAAMRSKR